MTDDNARNLPQPNPDLKTLERLIGTWSVSGEASGAVTYEWTESHFFLLQHVDLGGSKGIEVIGPERKYGEEPSVDIRSRYYGFSALPAARQATEHSTPAVEHEWALNRLEQFHTDGNRLSDHDGARMLVALESIGTRDALWADMKRENAASHVALWSDVTRRAPDKARAAPAALLGFSSWLSGDGARAWCALDQVSADDPTRSPNSSRRCFSTASTLTSGCACTPTCAR